MENQKSDTVLASPLQKMVMRDCNECPELWPKESEQSGKDPHICRAANRRVVHFGAHPLLPTPDWCPKSA
jgi:hypothetical protein